MILSFSHAEESGISQHIVIGFVTSVIFVIYKPTLVDSEMDMDCVLFKKLTRCCSGQIVLFILPSFPSLRIEE